MKLLRTTTEGGGVRDDSVDYVVYECSLKGFNTITVVHRDVLIPVSEHGGKSLFCRDAYLSEFNQIQQNHESVIINQRNVQRINQHGNYRKNTREIDFVLLMMQKLKPKLFICGFGAK